MLRTQLWAPDSCGCIFEEGWDDENPQAPHTLVNIVVQCPGHRTQGCYSNALKDNQLKNDVINNLVENKVLPNSMIDIQVRYDEETQQVMDVKNLHDRIKYKYYFTGEGENRKIIFSFEGIDKNNNVVTLSGTNKSNINNILNTKIGIGKHEIRDLLLADRNEDYKTHLKNTTFRDENYAMLTARYRQPTRQETETKSRLKAMKDFISSI